MRAAERRSVARNTASESVVTFNLLLQKNA